jgi:hypothetical protein
MTVYFLLVVFFQDSVGIESYFNKTDCEIRRADIKVNNPSLSTKCIRMEVKQSV